MGQSTTYYAIVQPTPVKIDFRPMLKTKQYYKDGLYVDTWLDQSYTTRYWIIIVDDWDKLENTYKGLVGETGEWRPGEHQAAFTEDFMYDGFFNVLIVFQRATTYGIIAHECIHAANMTFKHHGTKLDVNNDEHQAYYTQYLVNRCHIAFQEEQKLRDASKIKTRKRS